MIRWMCDVILRDKLSCVELRQQLNIEDMVQVVQRNRLRWYGHVLILAFPRSEIFGLALLQPACSVCISSERFFHL